MSLISYQRGQGSIILRVKILDSSVTTGAGLAGLVFNSAGLAIATIADNEAATTSYTTTGGTIETIATLGTFAAPTATKCRFKEVDATNHPGVYEIQLADARYGVANAKSLLVSVGGAANAAQCDVVVPLTDVNPYDVVRAGLTALPNAAADAAGGLPISDAGGLALDSRMPSAAATTNLNAEFDGTGYAGGTVKRQVDAVAISGDSAAADNLEAAFDGTGYSHLYQQAAREAHGVSGTVRHVAYNASETMGNDALSWATADLTAGAGVIADATACVAGDLLLIGAGTYLMGAGSIAPVTGVAVRGAGIDLTSISNTTVGTVELASNVIVEDLRITTSNSLGYPIGNSSGGAVTNAVVRRVHTVASADGFYISNAAACSVTAFDCIFESAYDAVALFGNTGSVIKLHDCTLNVIGPVAGSPSDGVWCNAGTLYLYNCHINCQDGTAGQRTSGLYAATSGNIIMVGGSIRTYNAAGTDLAVHNAGTGKIVLIGVDYDRTKTSNTGGGTITDIARVVTDASGNAHADVKLVKTVDAGRLPLLDDEGRLPVALQQIVGTAIDEDQSGNLAESFSELLDVPTTRPRQIVLASCNETDETALWTASGTGSIAWDADHSFRSVGSLTITAAADHTAQDAIFTPAATIYANGGLGIALRSDDASQIESLKIYLYYDADEYYWLNVPFDHATPKWKAAPAIGTDWRVYWRDAATAWGQNRSADLPVWGSAATPALPITKIVVRVTALTGQTVTINVGQILTNAVVTPVPICLHFDDTFVGVHSIAFPILTAAGLTGSVWVNVGTVGTAGYMTWTQIRELAAAGWEIASHASRNHESFPATVSEADAANLMTDNWRELVKEVPEAYQEGMVIPSGDAMLATSRFGNVAASVGHKVLFGRATRDGHTGLIGAYWLSICGLDAAVPSILQRIEAAEWSVDDFEAVNPAKGESGQGGQSLRQYFDTQVRFGNPILPFFHDVAAVSYDVYTITTAMFQQIVDWIVAGQAAGTVVPVSTAGLVQRMRGGDFPRTEIQTVYDKLPSRDYLAGSAAATGETQTDAQAALVANNLDHLLKTATVAADMTTEMSDNTILARVLAGGDTSTFTPGTMSQKDIVADTNELQGDWTDAGRLDMILDTIAADVAGLDGAAMLTQANVRTAVGLAVANLDTQLADLPTVAEFQARTKLAAEYADKATVDAIKVKTDQLNFTGTDVQAVTSNPANDVHITTEQTNIVVED